MSASLKASIQKGASELDLVKPDGRMLAIIGVTVVVLAAIYLAAVFGAPFQWAIRYLCIIPVVLVAYEYGLTAGIVGSAFFTTAFIPELIWLWRWNGFSAPVIELLAFMVFLNVLAYLVADITRTMRAEEALTGAVRDWQGLLARTGDLDQVIAYLLIEAQRLGQAGQAALLLRNPLDERWELITADETRSLLPRTSHQAGLSLVDWLVERGEIVLLHNLREDRRVQVPGSIPTNAVDSLLAVPMKQPDQRLLGMLVLTDSRRGRFERQDIANLRELLAGGEKALEYAGRYARTDRSLTRRLKQLGAIERTARQISATREPQDILNHTLDCALDVIDGDVGLVAVAGSGWPTMVCSHNLTFEAPDAEQFIARIQQLEHAQVIEGADAACSGLLPDSKHLWLAPIRRGQQVFGAVMVGRAWPHSGEEASLQALSSLTNHAAIALDNVRLFREIESERRKAKLIVDSVADGLLTTDRAGRIVSLNPAAEQLTGWRSEEVAGKLICEILSCPAGEECDGTCSLFAGLNEQRVVQEDQWVIRQRRGSQRVVSLSAAPLPANQGAPEGLVVRIRDITEEQEMERLQQELITGFSHELRTPLAYISTVAEMMLAEEMGANSSRRREYLNILVAQSKRLSGFADKLLDVSRLESGSWVLQPRPIPIDLVVEDIVQVWRSGAQRRTFLVQKPDRPAWVWADETAVETVLNSLIDNAVKYARQDSPITISIESDLSRFVQVAVQDGGPGISPQHQERVFDRFYRVHAADDQNVYGYGLGLWVAKGLIEAMGGQIWVTSELDCYSRFTFTVPQMLGVSDEQNVVDHR